MRFSAPGATAALPPHPGTPQLAPHVQQATRSRFSSPQGNPTGGHPPTGEQQRVIMAFASGENLVVEALAGTGKTTTLRMLAAIDTRRPGSYLVYNKSASMEAQGRFPQTVAIGTAHSFAYQAVGHRYSHRLPGRGSSSRRLYARDVVKMLGVRAGNAGGAMINPVMIARLAEAAVNEFCKTGDHEIGAQHLPPRAEHLGTREAVAAVVIPTARKIWADLRSETGRLYFTHDHYLKIWQLGRPTLPGEYVLFDEAQDANPVIAAVVAAQTNHQLVYVGDRNQQLYAWRGAIDAMSKVGGQRLALTKSFRFGPAIAEAANEWLALLGSAHRVVGHDPIRSTVGPIDGPADALLCRTNGTALAAILEYQEDGVRVAMAPGDKTAGKEILAFAYAARDLQANRGTDHPELAAFQTWSELLTYVEEEEGGADLQRMVGIINRIGYPAVISAIRNLSPKETAQVTVSTAHKAKGLEWNRVKVAPDFAPPDWEEDPEAQVEPADLMLAYVTVTRAKLQLDPGSLGDPLEWTK